MSANTANTKPIYTHQADYGDGALLTTASADYSGVSQYNKEVFAADAIDGSYLEMIRFKAAGTNVATVARIYVSNGGINTNWATASAAPTATPSTTGGTILTGNYFAMIVAINNKNSLSVVGSYSTSTAVTGPTGSIAWAWAAVPGAIGYRIYISQTTGFSTRFFTSATNAYTQTQMPEEGANDDPMVGNQCLLDEISLPATTASAVVATPLIEWTYNKALPPGYEVYVGLGTTVAAGWYAMAVGGTY